MASKQALVIGLHYTEAQLLHIQAVGLRRHVGLQSGGWRPITVASTAWFQVENIPCCCLTTGQEYLWSWLNLFNNDSDS